ncbi:MAG: cell division protein FtsW [Frankiales bacterium]|nr:cell division protein FtsW [Frankiales bacterium]
MTDVATPAPRTPRPRHEPRAPLLARPLASYHLLLGCTVLLLVLGLVMVFSASSLRSYATTGSVFSTGIKQATFIAFGVPLMMIMSRLPVRAFRAAAYPCLLVSLALLVAVLFVGNEVNGATSWIPLPMGFNLQPAELAKMAVVLWGADLLVRKQKLLGDRKHLLVPLLPVAGLVLGLVMLQPDLGTSVAIASIVVALLYVVGTPLRMFGALCAFLLGCVALIAVSSPHSMDRLVSFRDPFADAANTGYQAVQGFYALSSGGIFGRGLGASKEKWSGGLPEAHTDYVFAIIGEELGLLGTLTVLVLFGVLLYSGIRIAQRATDPFVRLCSFGVTAWLGCQAVINMGAVVGLLPITGIPLPLVSFGGSALLVTLAAIGMLLSFARMEPGAAAALRARPGVLDRLRNEGVPVPRQRTVVAGPRDSRGSATRSPAPRSSRTPAARSSRTPVRRPAGRR